DGKSNDEDNDDSDRLSQIHDDDDLAPGETEMGMSIPDGFRLQPSPPPALDQSLVKRGVLVKLGLGWFGGVLTRRAHHGSRNNYDY
ncbi:unnamed protein product, partial [Pylaiella littoralis]